MRNYKTYLSAMLVAVLLVTHTVSVAGENSGPSVTSLCPVWTTGDS